jgi:hypothetical protein
MPRRPVYVSPPGPFHTRIIAKPFAHNATAEAHIKRAPIPTEFSITTFTLGLKQEPQSEWNYLFENAIVVACQQVVTEEKA